jgi:D-glycero-D-manno-heptose 1,7-bisphosphate phosphatase
MRRAVFLDRDGTLNVRPDEHAYVESLDGFVWLAGALEGASALARAGFVLAVVSNQRGVARGLVSWATLTSIEHEIQARMRDAGAEITAFRYCPHDLADACDCRKPAPGMILALARTLDIDLPRSWMIGDSESDIAAGQAAGCRTALIDEPGSPARSRRSRPDIVAPSLDAAATAILRRAEPEPLSPA